MKKISFGILLALCCMSLAACGPTTMDNGNDTNGRPGEDIVATHRPTNDPIHNSTGGENGEGAQEGAENVTGGVQNGVNNARNATEDIAGGAGQAVGDMAEGAGNAAGDVARGVGDAAKNVADGVGNAVEDAANGVKNAVE